MKRGGMEGRTWDRSRRWGALPLPCCLLARVSGRKGAARSGLPCLSAPATLTGPVASPNADLTDRSSDMTTNPHTDTATHMTTER